MQIFVKTDSGRTIAIDAFPDMTIATVKTKIQYRTDIPAEHQRLIYGAKPLQDDKTLADYYIQNESTLHLVLRLEGGMKVLLKTLLLITDSMFLENTSCKLEKVKAEDNEKKR